MGDFGKSFKKELGRATGRRVANAVFGDKHASKHKVIIERERNERRQEREAIRAERDYDKEVRRSEREEEKRQREVEREQKRLEIEERKQLRVDAKAQKEEEKEYKRWLKEQEKIEKEIELEENQREFESFTNYLNTIQTIHQVPVDKFDWDSLILVNDNPHDNFVFSYLWEIKNTRFIDYELAILHLAWLVAIEDKKSGIDKSVTKEEDDYLNAIAKNENISVEWEEFNSTRELLNNDTQEIIEECIRSLSKAPLIFKIKAIGYMKKMGFVSQEDDLNNNMSDKEWELITLTAKELNIPYKLIRLSDNFEYLDSNTYFISGAYYQSSIDVSAKIPDSRPSENDQKYKERHTRIVITPIKEKIENLINSGKEKYGEKWMEVDYYSKISSIEGKLSEIKEIAKDKSLISNLLNKNKIELAKSTMTNLESEKTSLVSIQSEKSEIASYIELLNDINERLSEENNEMISFWNETWSSERQAYYVRKEKHEIATKVQEKQSNVFPEAIELSNILTFIQDFGSSLSLSFTDNNAEIDFFININDIVPLEKKVITQSRILSYKPFTDTERNILIQDYVCSSALRIAKEIFLTLPINTVIIHAYDTIINSSTGNNEDIVALSVEINESQFSNLNLDKIDPSDAIEGFNHNMKFTKSSGFGSVEKIMVEIKKRDKIIEEKIEIAEELAEPQNFEEWNLSQIKSNEAKAIKISSSLTVKDLQNQFKELFNKDIVVLTSKGNEAGENRKLRALTENDIKSEIIIPIDNLTKKVLKEIKKTTGLNLDY